jgi:hypothetical protein
VGERQHCRARASSPHRRSRSRFQGTCLSNGGRKVVGGTWPALVERSSRRISSRKIK